MLFVTKCVTLLFSALLLIGCSHANKLESVYQWQKIDFKYNTTDERQAAINSKAFIEENVIPVAMEVCDKRLFLTLPRLKPGVPASLAYIKLDELTVSQSPLLIPYPSWQAHTSLSPNDPNKIVSPIAIKADHCKHLWVLDAGLDENMHLLGYDLLSDSPFERFNITKEQYGAKKPNFTSIIVDDSDCSKIFVYIAVPSAPALIVYSAVERKSWRVNHNYFYTDPLAGNFSVGNVKYTTTDGVYGLALSDIQKNGFADLYFHPISSGSEFKVSTAVLRNETLATSGENYKHFMVVGARKTNGQSAASVFDAKNGVIFYTLPNLNEIGCWKITNDYAVTDIFTDPIQVTYPSDIRVTDEKQLWVLTNNLPRFLHDKLDLTLINFRILRGSPKELIKDTRCERTIVEKINKLGQKILPSTAKDPNHSNDIRPIGLTITIMSLLTVVKTYFY